MSAEAKPDLASQVRGQIEARTEDRVRLWSQSTITHLREALNNLNSRDPWLWSARQEIETACKHIQYAHEAELELRKILDQEQS